MFDIDKLVAIKKLVIINMILLTGLLSGGLTPIVHAKERVLHLEYQVFVGGLDAASVDLRIEIDAENYTVISEISSRGIIDAFIGFRSKAFTSGSTNDNLFSPAKHEVKNTWRGEQRSVVLRYKGGTPQIAEVLPPPEEDGRLPVKDSMKLATFDALTAALLASKSAVTNKHPCETTIPIFDGRRRYNMLLKGKSKQDVEGPVFSGATYLCELKIERIAGHSSSPWMPRRENENGNIWFARLASNWMPVPVRFETDIGMGSVVVHLIHASGDGIDPTYGKQRVAKD